MERTNVSESISVLFNALTSLTEELREYQKLLKEKKDYEEKRMHGVFNGKSTS